MQFFYNCFIYFYAFLIRCASVFNKKAKLRRNGVKDALKQIENLNFESSVWFHCASLGEFEQGRPVIEQIKKQYPQHKIIITFFSPSGYEIRKNYPLADFICYLPDDTPSNVHKFFKHLSPSIVYFIKYEFWYNYISYAYKCSIPIYLISGIFRENQYFFKWYGGFFRRKLQFIYTFFVQDEKSKQLVQQYIHSSVIQSGDTRFDRVSAIVNKDKTLPIIEYFKKSNPLVVVGSSWKADEDVILSSLKKFSNEKNVKVIIAPHEVHASRIEALIQQIGLPAIKYTEAELNDKLDKANFLIVNNIGILSYIYKYADIAYVGGAFGKGLHNILEAATFGMPILFGPNYTNFREARDLIELQTAYSIENEEIFYNILNELLNDKEKREAISTKSAEYVRKNQGATKFIVQKTLPL